MSDIRFNRWLHQSGTGGVYQDSAGNVGIGTSVPTALLDVEGGNIKIGSNTLSSSGVSTFSNLTVTSGSLTGITTIGVTTVSTTNLTVNGNNYPSDGPLSGARNRIINGDMRIDQRNDGAAVTTDNLYTVDRFTQRQVGGGAMSFQRSTTAPTGFVNSLSVTVTTADASIAAGDNYVLLQRIEGTNIADLGYGSANAGTVTLSFWVRSSLTGTFGGCLQNNAGDRSYVFQYTISATDTWEYQTITIPGATSGTWSTSTDQGISVLYDMGSGTNYEGTVNTWNSANNRRSSGNVQLVGTLNATFYITGVQLESGTIATPFERRSYGQELSLCQRYYQTGQIVNSGNISASSVYSGYSSFPVAMRVAPTAVTSGAFTSIGGGGFTATTVTWTPEIYGVRGQMTAGGNTNGGGFVRAYTASAEL